MTDKDSKYMRKIFAKDEETAKEVYESLSKYDPVILDDIYNFHSGYKVVHFKANKKEFHNLIKELELVYSQIVIRDMIHRVWMYEKKGGND